jgi:multisubunit Na+/H+ antiporter MnhF subunit
MSAGWIAVVAMGLAAALALTRLLAGPTLYDRALSLVAFNGKLALMAAGLAVATGQSALADLAVGYVVVSFAVALAAMKLLRLKSLQPSLAPRNPVSEDGA